MKMAYVACLKNSTDTLRMRGASLLEVLVAIVIMSFGLLAMGGLTVSSLQYGKMAQFQTVGVQLANDLVDRMRANREGFNNLNSKYEKLAVYAPPSTAVTYTPNCAASTCLPNDLANMDMADWRNSLRLGLPGGDAYVKKGAEPGSVDIWVMWMDPGLASGGDSSLITSGSASCPAAAIAGLTAIPHCLYFRAVI